MAKVLPMALSEWSQFIGSDSYNKYYNLKGHVWYDRFKSKIINNFQQLLATFRYICNNPVKAEMVDNPEEYMYGALWEIQHKLFDIVEPPNLSIKMALTDL